MGQWVQNLGEQIGTELGQIIAQSVQRTLEGSINVREIARKLGAGVVGNSRERRGRRPLSGEKAICKEPGCGRPVLAKGLCRSHYYRERYKAQKAGTLVPRGRGRKASGRRLAAEAGNS
jgi:hypothetical protein